MGIVLESAAGYQRQHPMGMQEWCISPEPLWGSGKGHTLWAPIPAALPRAGPQGSRSPLILGKQKTSPKHLSMHRGIPLSSHLFSFLLTFNISQSSSLLKHLFQEFVKLSSEICAARHAKGFT